MFQEVLFERRSVFAVKCGRRIFLAFFATLNILGIISNSSFCCLSFSRKCSFCFKFIFFFILYCWFTIPKTIEFLFLQFLKNVLSLKDASFLPTMPHRYQFLEKLPRSSRMTSRDFNSATTWGPVNRQQQKIQQQKTLSVILLRFLFVPVPKRTRLHPSEDQRSLVVKGAAIKFALK